MFFFNFGLLKLLKSTTTTKIDRPEFALIHLKLKKNKIKQILINNNSKTIEAHV